MVYQKLQPKNVIDENDPKVSKFGHPAPPWLVNYADLMTEMVCFFIILYALSSVLSKPIQEAKREIERIIKEEQLKAEVKFTKEGIRLTLEEEGSNSYFEVGRAELTAKMTHLMTKLGPVFTKMPNEILIEGHTDDRPINTP
jgi:chemotaxis protein MotB